MFDKTLSRVATGTCLIAAATYGLGWPIVIPIILIVIVFIVMIMAYAAARAPLLPPAVVWDMDGRAWVDASLAEALLESGDAYLVDLDDLPEPRVIE